MKLKAKPARFQRAFLGETSAPGVEVEEIGDSLLSDNPCIVLELQDIQQAIIEGLTQEPNTIFTDEGMMALANDPSRGVARYYLGLGEAKVLFCRLIHALSNTDDMVARQLWESTQQIVMEAEQSDLESS